MPPNASIELLKLQSSLRNNSISPDEFSKKLIKLANQALATSQAFSFNDILSDMRSLNSQGLISDEELASFAERFSLVSSGHFDRPPKTASQGFEKYYFLCGPIPMFIIKELINKHVFRSNSLAPRLQAALSTAFSSCLLGFAFSYGILKGYDFLRKTDSGDKIKLIFYLVLSWLFFYIDVHGEMIRFGIL